MGWQDAPVVEGQGWKSAPVVGGQSPSESGTPAPRKATTAELALASPPARMALGLATPFVGAVQVGANVGDWINEKIGQKPVVSKAIADWWNNVQAMKERGMAASSPEAMYGVKPVDVAGTLAGIALPMGAAGKANTVMQAVKEGAKVGAITGAAQPGTEKLTDQALGATVGGTIGAAAPIAIPAAAKAAGWVMDAASGNMFQIKAGKILRQISGDKLPEIRAALAQANPELTAAQAVQEAGITAPVLQAMGARGAQERAGPAAERMLREEAGRMNALQKVTPDLEQAIAARDQSANALYGQARNADRMRQQLVAEEVAAGNTLRGATGYKAPNATTPALDALRQNPVIAAAAKEAKVLAASSGNPVADPMASLEGLHMMKVAIDNQFKNRTASTALQNYSDAALNNTKAQLLAAIEGTANQPGISPLYGAARQTYASMSPPVNQAQVLNQMAAVLQKPGGGERVTPFLNVLGRGEDALLKRANQSPRFGGLEDVLTPQQMQTTTEIARQMTRDAEMERLAGMGSRQLSKILKEEPTSLPPTGKVAIVFNRVANTLKGKVSDKTMDALAKGVESGADASALLATLPAVDRNAVLKAMTDAKLWASKAGIGLSTGAASGTVNMMRPKESEIQNALVK
jgi:hypothetical protein